MIKIETTTMTKAIAKANTVHPRVKVISAADRTYSVTGSKGDNYTVKFAVSNGHKLAECDCAARGLCYHIAAAAQVNVMTQSMRQGATAPAPLETATDRANPATVTDWHKHPFAQRCKVEALTTAIRLRGDIYTLTRDGKDILVEDSGKLSRVDRKGRVTFNDNPEFAQMRKPQPRGTYCSGWNI